MTFIGGDVCELGKERTGSTGGESQVTKGKALRGECQGAGEETFCGSVGGKEEGGTTVGKRGVQEDRTPGKMGGGGGILS